MEHDDYRKPATFTGYKALRGAAILARHHEKETRSRVEALDEGQMAKFDELFGMKDEALLNKAVFK